MENELLDFITDALGVSSVEHKQLAGYGSLNYKVWHGNGVYLVKHYTSLSDFNLVQAEVKIIAALQRHLDIDLPIAEKELLHYKKGFIRISRFVKGHLLTKANLTPALLSELGMHLGQMSVALSSIYNSEVKARTSYWDNSNALLNIDFLIHIKNPAQKKLVLYFLDQFEQFALPKLSRLRSSILHGDINENNILVADNAISGIIDFGDICHSATINEVAIALTYIGMLDLDQMLSHFQLVLRSYHLVYPLQREEVDLLYFLISARICTSLLNSSKEKALNGASEYILQNELPAWKMLQAFLELSPIHLKQVCYEALDWETAPSHSSDLKAKRTAHFGPMLSLSYTDPIHFSSSAFQYMYDADGNTFLDAYNNIPHVGHCHPRLSRVISDQVRTLNTNTRYLYDSHTKYSEKLLSYFPSELDQLFLVNSGSAATDLALRIAFASKGTQVLAVLDHGYHGNTKLGINASAYKFDGKGGDGNPNGVIKLPLPKAYNGRHSSGEDYALEAISILTEQIKSGNCPAAFIAEPVSGCGGQVPLAPNYLTTLLPFLKAHGILFISDEVQVGFGRLGTHFWGFEFHQVIPDMVILGKPMANGHPIGGVVCSTELSQAFHTGMEFFSSFGGNPVSCVIGLEVLQVIEDEQLQRHALEVGNYYVEELTVLKDEYDFITDVRGSGLFIGIEIEDDSDSKGKKLAGRIKNRMRDHFILLSTDGPNDSVIKTKPPLCFTKQNVNTVISTFRKVFTELNL